MDERNIFGEETLKLIQHWKAENAKARELARKEQQRYEEQRKAETAEYEAKQAERKNIEKTFLETGDPAILTSGQRVSAEEVCSGLFQNHLDKLNREETLVVLAHISNKGEIEEKYLEWPTKTWSYLLDYYASVVAIPYLEWIQSMESISTANAMKIGGTIQVFSLKSQMAYLSLFIEWFSYASPEHYQTALHILQRVIGSDEKIAILPLTLQRIHEQVPKMKAASAQMQMLRVLSAYHDHRNIMFFFNALHDDAQPENQQLQAQVALFLQSHTLPDHFSEYIEEWEKIVQHSTHRALAAKAGAILLNQGRISTAFFYHKLIEPYFFKRKELKRIFKTLEHHNSLSTLKPLTDADFLDMLYQMLKHRDFNVQNRAMLQICKYPLTEQSIQTLHHTLNNTTGHQRDFIVKHFSHALSNGDLAPEIRQLKAFRDAVHDILAVKLETPQLKTLFYLNKLKALR